MRRNVCWTGWNGIMPGGERRHVTRLPDDIVSACMMQTTQANDFDHDHEAWDVLLKRHIVDIEQGLIRGSAKLPERYR